MSDVKEGAVTEPVLEENAVLEAEGEELEATAAQETVKTAYFKAGKSWLVASFLATLFVAMVASIATESGAVYAFLGFTPTLCVIIVFYSLLEGGYKDVLYWVTPMAFAMLFFLLGEGLNSLVYNQLDIPVLTGVNLIAGYLVLVVLLLIEYYGASADAVSLEDVAEFKPEDLGRYISSIEDKCKALNFVIGRTYRASNGGTKELREKIKVASEWYNEFNSIPPEEVRSQKGVAIELLSRIEERLHELLKPEKDVFAKKEVTALKHLARDPEGKDRIIDVLSVNDNDPVEDYFLGAMDFCKQVKTELKKL